MMGMLIGLIMRMISQCRCISKHRIVHLKYVQFFICKLYLHKTLNKTKQNENKPSTSVDWLLSYWQKTHPPGYPPAPVPPERILCSCPSNTDLGAIPTPDDSFAFPRKSHREVGADSSPSMSLSFPLWGNSSHQQTLKKFRPQLKSYYMLFLQIN